MQKLRHMIESLEDRCQNIRIQLVSGPGRLRGTLAEIEDFKNLAVNLRKDLVLEIHREMDRPETPKNADIVYSALCYLLELAALPESVPTLVSVFTKTQEGYLFAPSFAVHALKIITKQDDLDTDYYTYSLEEGLATVAEAQTWFATWEKSQESQDD